MKASVQILLTVAVLIPLCSRVFGETMEERKQRIMRKYLSEAQTLEQSDLAPRINELEAALLDDSRKLQQVQSGINSRNTLTAPPSAPMAQPIPAKENRNWLLDEEDPDADPYADPFAMDSGSDTGSSGRDLWTQLQARQQAVDAARQDPAANTYDYRTDRTYSTVGQGSYSYPQQGTSSSYPSSYSQYPDTTYSPESSGQLGPYGAAGYGSDPLGQLQLPGIASQSRDNSQPQTPNSGYTPSSTSFDSTQQRQQAPSQAQPSDFMRTTPYQQWKDNNQGWDPSADDAYLNELMQRNRR